MQYYVGAGFNMKYYVGTGFVGLMFGDGVVGKNRGGIGKEKIWFHCKVIDVIYHFHYILLL